jgi:hypothetical protein
MADQKLPQVKGSGEGGGLDNLHLQDSGEGDLKALNLQGKDQHQQAALQEMSNVAKKVSDVSGSIITGKVGGGGGQPKTGIGLGLLAALLVLGIAAFVGVRFLVPGMMPPDTTIPEPGPPEVNIPVPGPPDQPVQYPPNPCALEFENPTGPESIPLSGPLGVQWSRLPGAAAYEFRVIPPEGAGDPWLIKTDGTSKKIYMENFPAAGQHTFALTALDRGGAALCSIEMVFDKPAFGGEGGQARDSEGPECDSLLLACR